VSLARLEEHREVWRAKPLLRSVYEVWFDIMLGGIPTGSHVLEIGAGPGFLAEYARRQRPDVKYVASDIIPSSWNDLAADATKLPVAASSIDMLIGIDVLHHLEDPDRFFTEAARVLHVGGSVAVIEPWITPFSFLIYGLLHEEACRPWAAPWERRGGEHAFDGDNARVWALARSQASKWIGLGFEPPAIRPLNGFAWFSSLGFKRPSLLPGRAARSVLGLDRMMQPLARWLALRAHLVWRRR
jgi:SAM-dependent methyltransferase